MRDRRISSNPAGVIDLPRLPKGERRYLTHAQLAKLARARGDAELLVLVLGSCGLRYGEAAALRVRRVDTMRRRLDTAEAMTTISGKVEFGTPKTHQARSDPVPAFLKSSDITTDARSTASSTVDGATSSSSCTCSSVTANASAFRSGTT